MRRASGPLNLQNNGTVKLNSGSVSAAATLDIVMTGYTAYKHKLLLFSLRPATDGVTLLLRFSTDGGSTFDAGATDYAYGFVGRSDVPTDLALSAATTSIGLSPSSSVGNGAAEGCSGRINIYDTTDATLWTRCDYQVTTINNGAGQNNETVNGGGSRRAAQDTDAIRMLFDSGNIASGTWALYGYQ